MDKSIYSGDYFNFLRLLRSLREEGGLTQEEVAARLGETQSFVSKCERGERRLDIVETKAWCVALNMSLSDLVDKFENSSSSREISKRQRAK